MIGWQRLICRCATVSLRLAMLAELWLGILGLDAVEGLGQKLVASLLHGSSLCLLIKGLLTFSWHYRLFNGLLECLVVSGLSVFLVVGIVLNRGNAQENVFLQVIMLDLFPLRGEVADRTLSKLYLLRCEFAVLA